MADAQVQELAEPEYIDISSDTDSNGGDGEAAFLDADADAAFEAAFVFDDFAQPPEHNQFLDAFWDLIDDPATPAPLDPQANTSLSREDLGASEDQLALSAGPSTSLCIDMLTPETCIIKVVEILPDVCEDHVRQLYELSPPLPTDGHEWLDRFIANLLESGPYPKRQGLKRKRENEDKSQPWDEFERPGRPEPDRSYTTAS